MLLKTTKGTAKKEIITYLVFLQNFNLLFQLYVFIDNHILKEKKKRITLTNGYDEKP